MSECDREASVMRGPWPTGRGGGACQAMAEKRYSYSVSNVKSSVNIIFLTVVSQSMYSSALYS